MKKINRCLLISVASGLMFTSILSAQVPQRCATDLVTKIYEQKHPEFAERRKAFDRNTEKFLREHNYKSSRDVITIPVVVHLIYRTNLENIPDAQILSQIDVLNRDYGRTNTDTNLTPAPWKNTAASTGIQFCLASRKPNGDWTNGIERRQNLDHYHWQPLDSMKFYDQGGLDIWDPNSYLNIWVCNLSDNYLGYTVAALPIDTLLDGIVVTPRAFGNEFYVYYPFDLGRTATHEVGHWLGMHHIWGDDQGGCLGVDGCGDTPDQANSTSGCPVFPVYDGCSPTYPGIMFMNYMDYTDDACMNMFTQCQANKMHMTIDTFRVSILSSAGCTAPSGVIVIDANNGIHIYPNPARNEIRFSSQLFSGEKISVSICDVTGKEIFEDRNFQTAVTSSLNVSAFDSGVYYLRLTGKHFSSISRFVLIR